MIQQWRIATVVFGVVGAWMAYAGSMPDHVTGAAAWLATALAALAINPNSGR